MFVVETMEIRCIFPKKCIMDLRDIILTSTNFLWIWIFTRFSRQSKNYIFLKKFMYNTHFRFFLELRGITLLPTYRYHHENTSKFYFFSVMMFSYFLIACIMVHIFFCDFKMLFFPLKYHMYRYLVSKTVDLPLINSYFST